MCVCVYKEVHNRSQTDMNPTSKWNRTTTDALQK